jgi:putative transposase
MPSGFMYLTAVIDWSSRYVIDWGLSKSLEVLEEALGRGKPEVFNTDPGAQFTAEAFTSRLERAGVSASRTVEVERWTPCSWSGSGEA